MRRPAGIIVSGVLLIFSSILLLGMGLLFWLSMELVQNMPQARAAGAPPKAAYIVLIVFFHIAAAWSLLTGVGLLMGKDWARISALVIATFWVTFGAIGLLSLLTVPVVLSLAKVELTGATLAGLLIIAVLNLALLGVGIWWLVYFNRATVRAAFATGEQAPAAPPGPTAPVSVTVIGWLLLTSSPFAFSSLFLDVPVPFLGLLLTGISGKVAIFLLGSLGTLCGYWLVRLKPYGWGWALGYQLFGLASFILSLISPAVRAWMREEVGRQGAAFPGLPFEMVMQFAYCFGAVIIIVCLYFLLTRRAKYFEAAHARWRAAPSVSTLA
jgi:hypothetical protein